MKNRTRHFGTIENLERLPRSKNGNPRFQFIIDGYRVRTKPDSAHGYSIENYVGKPVEVIVGTHYGKLTLDGIWIDRLKWTQAGKDALAKANRIHYGKH